MGEEALTTEFYNFTEKELNDLLLCIQADPYDGGIVMPGPFSDAGNPLQFKGNQWLPHPPGPNPLEIPPNAAPGLPAVRSPSPDSCPVLHCKLPDGHGRRTAPYSDTICAQDCAPISLYVPAHPDLGGALTPPPDPAGGLGLTLSPTLPINPKKGEVYLKCVVVRCLKGVIARAWQRDRRPAIPCAVLPNYTEFDAPCGAGEHKTAKESHSTVEKQRRDRINALIDEVGSVVLCE